MSFVTALPEELAAAAAKLQGLGSGMAAQNAAAAAPTTGVIPAAADPVSALQAALFSGQGTLYQQISADATAIHESLVNTLGTNAGSYTATEASNQVAAAANSGGLAGIINAISTLLGGPTNSSGFGGAFGASSNAANVISYEGGNWASAMSDVIGLGGGGLWEGPGFAPVEAATAADVTGGMDGTVLAGAVGPAGGGLAGAPMLAGMGQAPSVGGLSVPPSWAGAGTVSSTAPATLTGAGWTSAAPESTPVATVPAGMPAVATAGKSAGFGAPRYGAKPTVMPKPAVV